MKKFMIFAVIALFAGITACKQSDEDKEKAMQDSMRLAQLQTDYNEASTFNDSLLLLMGDIYAGLDSINAQEGLLNSPGVIGDNVDKRQQIRDNLNAIRARLQKNKQLLAELEKKANDAGETSKVLQRTIDNLKRQIADQDTKISQLTQQLEQANQKITELTGQVEQKDQQIATVTQEKEVAQAETAKAQEETRQVTDDANTVYYVKGTNKQLKEWKVLEKKFLGSTKIMQGDNINYSVFTKADKRTLTSIPTGAKKVEIKSLNDKNSYQIQGDENGPKTIVITNRDLFWQKTPYLVIETKN